MPTGPSPFDGNDETAASSLPRQLGSYMLLQRLGRGGMGTVYLARQSLGGSFERLCVVKLVRRRHLGDPVLRQRFLDEARTTLLLTHRNICRVLDVGTVDGLIYLAMEHVNGRDLRSVLKRCAQLGRAMPPEIAASIMGEILEALDSAHRLADPSTGKPMELVHRDVSPHNVMVSFEGEVKLIDFGVARSATQLAQTDPGLVVGKMAYMSPEQSLSKPAIDGRSDVFAAGILGYETFATDRFYSKLTLEEIGQMLDDGSYSPPRFKELPPGVQKLLSRALTHDVNERPRAGELRKELMAWCVEQKKVAGAADVRAFLGELFPGEEQADRARFQQLFQRNATSDDDEPEPETASEGSLRMSQSLVEQTVQDRPKRSDSTGSARGQTSHPATGSLGRRQRRGAWLAAAAATIAIAGVAVGMFVVKPPRGTPSTSTVPAARAPAATAPPVATTVPPVPPPAPVPAPVAPVVAPVAAPVVSPVAAPEPVEPVRVSRRPSARRPPPATTTAPSPSTAAASPTTATTTTSAADAAKTAEPVTTTPPPAKPALPARPRLLAERVRYLRAHCAALGCASDVDKRYAGIASLTADQVEAFKAVVDKCLDSCGAP